MDIGYLIRRGAQWFPDNIFLVDGETRFTFQEVNAGVNRLANALFAAGCHKGDRVGILLPNRWEYILSDFGIMKAGMVVVPLNPRLRPEEYGYILKNAEARALIFDAEYADGVGGLAKELEGLRQYFCVGDSFAGRPSYADVLQAQSPEEPRVEIDENEDLCLMKYTSGTTGKPKGVMLTHRGLRAVATNLLADRLHIDERDCLLASGPLTHATGFYVLPFWIKGGRVVINRRFDTAMLIATIQKEKVTHLMLVPTMVRILVDHPDIRKTDLKSLTQINYGASPISPELLKEAIEIFGSIFVQGYGLTEAPVTSTMLRKVDHVAEGTQEEVARLASIGRELTNVEAKIVDSKGKECPCGEVGEIILRSDTVMKGYWRLPEETRLVLKDGWVYTGDIGRMDEKGYIYLIDRKSDLIISGGFNVYPKEVESVLDAHPKVRESAVLGVPDRKWGEAIKALVVLKEGCAATEEELINFCRDRLADFKKPKSVEFVDRLPRSSFDKVDRKILREKYWKGLDRRIS